MNNRSVLLFVAGATLLALPLSAFAHEHRIFKIGSKTYLIEVGFINEPVRTGDKSGMEMEVQDLGTPAVIHQPMEDGGGDEDHSGAPVTGLEQTLKVDVSAGGQTVTYDLQPTWGVEGAYYAPFYPTAQTTYSFRLLGTINGIPVDITYACNPAAGEEMPEETTEVMLSDSVTQLSKEGAFGCPKDRTEVEFPSPSGMSKYVAGSSEINLATVGTMGAAVALVIALIALVRTRKKPGSM